MEETPTIHPAHGLDEVLSSTARLRVARLFVELPDKEFTGREVARLLGTSHSTVLPALRSLANIGLVTERVLGRAHVFRMNRDSFLYDLLARLFRSEREQGRRIVELIRTSLEPCSTSVVLFGSRAREGAQRRGDVDLLVVPTDVEEAEAAVARLRARLRRTYGLELDAKVLTRDELKAKRGAPFVRAARSEGVLVGGVPLEEVVRSAA